MIENLIQIKSEIRKNDDVSKKSEKKPCMRKRLYLKS